MASTVQITIDNKMSSGNQPDKAFDIALASGTPLTTSGTVLSQPTHPIGSRTVGSGGIYSAPSDSDVCGVVGYTLPSGQTNLVIYFDTKKCRIDLFPSADAITKETVETVAKDDKSEVKGSFVIGDLYNYTVKAHTSASGDVLKCTVTLTSSS